MPARTVSCRLPLSIEVRRFVLIATALAALTCTGFVCAQASGAEVSLRDTIAQYAQAWNTHDTNAWTRFLTADVDYGDPYSWGGKGRDGAVAKYEYNLKNQDLKWEAVRLKLMPDGTATVLMRTEFGVLPITDGKYKFVFKSYPAISRWRIEDGQWRMFYFTTLNARAAEIVQTEGLE
jgi:hypothetical protein